MSQNWSERKVVWLLAGVGLGLALAAYWPHEQAAYAETAVIGDKFAMCTCNSNVGDADAIFVLDFATGRLIGGVFNNKTNTFDQPMIRNVAQDFGLKEAGKYAMVTGFVGPRSTGGQPASGGVYIGELTSGQVVLYGFINVLQGTRVPQELSILGNFSWRASGR